MSPDVADGVQFAGSIFDMNPDGQTFVVPLVLDVVVSGPPPAEGFSLGLFLFDRTINKWTLEASSSYDAAAGKVVVRLRDMHVDV
eukprot:115738-Rhodomonas_salina.1